MSRDYKNSVDLPIRIKVSRLLEAVEGKKTLDKKGSLLRLDFKILDFTIRLAWKRPAKKRKGLWPLYWISEKLDLYTILIPDDTSGLLIAKTGEFKTQAEALKHRLDYGDKSGEDLSQYVPVTEATEEQLDGKHKIARLKY